MTSTALIDGDIVAYRASVAAQDDVDWGDGREGLTVDANAAKRNANSLVEKWLALSTCDRAIVCLSPRDRVNYRNTLEETGGYKEDRGEKPVAYWETVDALEERWETKVVPHVEADDILGIMSTSAKHKAVVVSIDKDLQTIPGLYLNPLKDEEPREITELEADRFWMKQTLMGDRVDGYLGCPGIGEKRSTELLARCSNLKQMWKVVAETYTSKGLDVTAAITQARYARILRVGDYKPETGAIALWHPRKGKTEWITL